jgi:hypothetical protein
MNKCGFEAYITTDKIRGELWTPPLSKAIAEAHQRAGRKPIAVYPEILTGNPLNTPHVMRFLLNRPGLRAPNGRREEIEKFWTEPERAREFVCHFADEFQSPGRQSHSLWLPTIDTDTYKLPPEEPQRDGFLVYTHRVKFAEEAIPQWARPYTLISMANPRGPQELALLYQHSRGLITFELTGAIGEAVMCGCPVVCIPNAFFTERPSHSKFANFGVGWGGSEEQLEWSRKTGHLFRNLYTVYTNHTVLEVRERCTQARAFFANQSARNGVQAPAPVT